MTRRWTVTYEVSVESALHTAVYVRSGDVDAVLLRDGLGRPIVAGTTVAGALRDAWRALADGHAPGDPADRWFGSTDVPSRIWVDDLVAEPGVVPVTRTGVSIDPEHGTAKRGLLYDRELLPAGTVLRGILRFTTGPNDTGAAMVVKLLLRRFELLGLDLGGGRTRGEGRCQLVGVTAEVRHRSTAQGIAAIVAGQPDVHDDGLTALEVEAPGINLPGRPRLHETWRDDDRTSEALLVPDRRHLVVGLRTDEPVYAGASTGGPASAADIVPETIEVPDSGTHLVLRGSGIKGALRATGRRILLTAGVPEDDHIPLDWLFGTNRVTPVGTARQPGRGALRIGDCISARPVGDGPNSDALGISTHVALDRWTGGAVEHALWTVEEPATPPAWRPLQLEIDTSRLPSEQPLRGATWTLLWLVLAELRAGRVPLGRGTRRGRGALRVTGFRDQPPWKMRDDQIPDLQLGAFSGELRDTDIEQVRPMWREWIAATIREEVQADA